MKTGKMHFSVSGEVITKMVRDLVLEENIPGAWKILETIVGDNATEAGVSILKGEKRLEGINEFDLLDEDPTIQEDYLSDLNWLYAGRIKVTQIPGRRINGWFRPVARITSWGPEDLKNDHGIKTSWVYNTAMQASIINRGWHYCVPGEIILPGMENIVFEPCGEPPYWFDSSKTPQGALQQFEKYGRELEERGYSLMYGGQPREPIWEPRKLSEDDRVEKEIQELEREEAYRRRVASLRERILEQAGEDFIELTWGDQTAKVPRIPFVCWALHRRKKFAPFLPNWVQVSESGMKLMNDDPYHTDWMIGGGIDLNLAYDPLFEDACIEQMNKIQGEIEQTNCTVLVEGTSRTGRVTHGAKGVTISKGTILVLPNLQPKWLPLMQNAEAIICENGGAAAHLAQIGREMNLPIVRVKDARSRFPEGSTVTVDSAQGEIFV